MENALGTPLENWTSPYTQQGDVLLKMCGEFKEFVKNHNDIPEGAEEIGGNLVLKGQTNSHALYGGEFKLYRKENTLFVHVISPTVLDHVRDHTASRDKAEHHAQWIPPGKYWVDQVMEYDHIAEEARAIID